MFLPRFSFVFFALALLAGFGPQLSKANVPVPPQLNDVVRHAWMVLMACQQPAENLAAPLLPRIRFVHWVEIAIVRHAGRRPEAGAVACAKIGRLPHTTLPKNFYFPQG